MPSTAHLPTGTQVNPNWDDPQIYDQDFPALRPYTDLELRAERGVKERFDHVPPSQWTRVIITPLPLPSPEPSEHGSEALEEQPAESAVVDSEETAPDCEEIETEAKDSSRNKVDVSTVLKASEIGHRFKDYNWKAESGSEFPGQRFTAKPRRGYR